jgi:hypothetical protein
MALPLSVIVTVNGKKITVPAGIHSFKELVQATGVSAATKQFAVTPVTPASTINGNDSYQIVGGEVLTSS